MKRVSLSLMIAIALHLLCGQVTHGQRGVFGFFGDIPEAALKSKEAAEAEAARVLALEIPEYELIAHAVEEAEAQIKQCEELKARSVSDSIDFQAIRGSAKAALDALVSAAANKCDPASMEHAAFALNNALEPLIIYQDGFAAVSVPAKDLEGGTTADERVAAREFLATWRNGAVEQQCSMLLAPDAKTRLESNLSTFLKVSEKERDNAKTLLANQQPLVQTVEAAWTKRKQSLNKALASQRQRGSDRLLDQLPWLIIIFCVFGVALIACVAIFQRDIQMEWVASGQVIQFATVMVLLITISALGIAHILLDNNLGTLLGGVAGYVLSQGVGRAAARSAAQAQKTGSDLDARVVSRTLPRTTVKAQVTGLLAPVVAKEKFSPIDESQTIGQDLGLDESARNKLGAQLSEFSVAHGGKAIAAGEVKESATVKQLIELVSSRAQTEA